MPLVGSIAAVVTPMSDGGSRIDDGSFGPLIRHVDDGGAQGILACGTTGEGMLLSVEERRRCLELFLAARPEGFLVAAHCGAQSTDETVLLAAHARDAGADAVAVIGPPYFPLDAEEILAHLIAAAEACSPVPFYVYEYAARSGYAIPIEVIRRLATAVDNLSGMKVSDAPIEAVRPYLELAAELGIDVFIGSEPLISEGLEGGAAGTVSAIAGVWPGTIVDLVNERSDEAAMRVEEIRGLLGKVPFQAALKEALVAKGVIAFPDVRPPLRGLSSEERDAVLALALR